MKANSPRSRSIVRSFSSTTFCATCFLIASPMASCWSTAEHVRAHDGEPQEWPLVSQLLGRHQGADVDKGKKRSIWFRNIARGSSSACSGPGRMDGEAERDARRIRRWRWVEDAPQNCTLSVGQRPIRSAQPMGRYGTGCRCCRFAVSGVRQSRQLGGFYMLALNRRMAAR